MTAEMVVLGTSILWGQGLLEEEKIHTLVKKMLEDRGLVMGGPLAVRQLAHSGATIGYMDNDEIDPTHEPRVDGEVPTFYPTMIQQLDEFDQLYGKASTDAVKLVLVEGGINDVGLEQIVNPLVPDRSLRAEIENHCYEHMKRYLLLVAAKFPNAKIVVMAYYRFITAESHSDYIHRFIAALGLLPGKLDDAILSALGDLEKASILQNCDLFAIESTNALQRAVDEANVESNPNGEPRIMLAVPDIQLRNAAFTGNPYIWGIHRNGTAQDRIAAKRAIACEAASFQRTVVPICKVASAGHPNPKGAQAYANSIVALLEHQPAREFTPRFEVGKASQIRKTGVWFKDHEGRYVLFRGMNVATRAKLPPYVPILPLDVTELDWATVDERGLPTRFAQELDAVKPEFERLARLGINMIRLVLMWKGLEPQPTPDPSVLSPDGKRYMRLVKAIIDMCYELGMFTLIDVHQDLAHEVYGGDGFPDWAIAVDKDHPKPQHPGPRPSPKWMLRYYDTLLTTLDKHVRHTLQSFWRNAVHNAELSPEVVAATHADQARTHLEKTFGAMAHYLTEHGSQAILGYEPFNEPHAVGLGTQEYEAHILPAFYNNVLQEIRKWDSTAFLFVEPRVDWSTFDPKGPEFDGLNMTEHPVSLLDTRHIKDDPKDDRLVFSFHFYDNETYVAGEPSLLPPNIPHGVNMEKKIAEWPFFFRQLREAATNRKLIPFMTEFGGDQDWTFKTNLRPELYQTQIRAYMDLEFQQVESLLLNAAYWDYDLYNTKDGKNNWNDENSSLLGPDRVPLNLDIAARVYPMRSSAEPTTLHFDIGTKHGTLILTGKPVAALTVIYVPMEMHYPNGFEVRATSPDLAWDAKRQLLFWKPDSRAEHHQIIVSPRYGFKQSALPADAFELIGKTVYFWTSPDA